MQAFLEVGGLQSAGKAGSSSCGENMRGAGDIVADDSRRKLAAENGPGVANALR